MNPTKPITDMSREELEAEINRLQAFKVPAAPTGKAPKKARDVKPRKPKWQDQLGL